MGGKVVWLSWGAQVPTQQRIQPFYSVLLELTWSGPTIMNLRNTGGNMLSWPDWKPLNSQFQVSLGSVQEITGQDVYSLFPKKISTVHWQNYTDLAKPHVGVTLSDPTPRKVHSSVDFPALSSPTRTWSAPGSNQNNCKTICISNTVRWSPWKWFQNMAVS